MSRTAANFRKILEKKTPSVAPRIIMDALKISGDDKGKVGVRKLKYKEMAEIDDKQTKTLFRVVRNIFIRTAKSFLPKDTETLLCAAVEELPFESKVKENFLKSLDSTRLQTREKRLMRTLIFGVVGGVEARHMISADFKKRKT